MYGSVESLPYTNKTNIRLCDNWNKTATLKPINQSINQSRPLGFTIHTPIMESQLPVDNRVQTLSYHFLGILEILATAFLQEINRLC